MRTLKKVLALTIALATLFSLTAFAAYKDESAIASETMSAVNLVNSLKIMTGDTKGNFNPTATITRAEAAKMVFVVRTGGKTDADGWKGQNVFTDTKGHWAEGFINYCASVGIIAGVGNGKFNPEGKLTGVELAKMLLVAAGYKADIQGYTGSVWQAKVLADAENASLFANYAPAYIGAAPRQYAAVMFSNCLLKANMAIYLNGELATGSIGTPVLVGTKYFGLAKVEGLPTAFSATSVSVGGKNFNDVKTNMDLRGQEIVVVYNNSTNEVYDMYASGKSKVYNVNASDIDLSVNASTKVTTLEFPNYDETTYAAKVANTTAADIKVYLTSANAYPVAPATSMDTLATALTGYKNHLVRFIDETSDGLIDTAIVFDAQYDTVASNVPADGEFELDNVSGYDTDAVKDYNKLVFVDTVEKGDVVKLVTNMAGQKTIAKLEAVKGTLTAKSGADYTIGGAKYKLSATPVTGFALSALTLGTEYNLYTDGTYAVYAEDAGNTAPTEFSTNIALVVAAQAKSGDAFNAVPAKVQVVLATGETKIYEWGGTTTEMTALLAEMDSATAGVDQDNKVVKQYTLKDGKITLKNVVEPADGTTTFTANATATFKYTKSTNVFVYGGSAAKVTANTYFFMQKNGDASKFVVVKASELMDNVGVASVANAAGAAYTTKNGVNTLAFAYIPAQAPVAEDVSTFAIVNGVIGDKWDAVEEATVKFIAAVNMKGEKIEILLTEDALGKVTVNGAQVSTVVKGIYEVVTDADGFSVLKTPTTDYNTATISGFDSTSIVVGGNFIDFASNMTTIFVDEFDTDGTTPIYKILTGKKLADTDRVAYVLNADGDEITTLIVLR